MDQAGQSTPNPSTVQTNTPESSPKSYIKVIIALILLGLLAGGIYAAYTFVRPKSSTLDSPNTVQNVESGSHYVGSQIATLNDVSGGASAGAVTRTVSQNNVSFIVNATLPDPPEGQFHQAWVVNRDGAVLSVGRLSQNQDGSFSLNTSYEFDPSETFTLDDMYNTFIVTLEITDDDLIENSLLEGVFTEQ